MLVSLLLLALTLCFAFFSNTTDPLLHSKAGLTPEMLMAAKVTLVDNDGHPAPYAVATLDNVQQARADANGVVYFDNVMLHDNSLNIIYQGQHYTVPVHLHNAQNTVSLGLSQETHLTLTMISAALLVAWLIFCLVCAIKKWRQVQLIPERAPAYGVFHRLTLKTRRMVAFSALALAFIVVSLVLNPFSNAGTTNAAGGIISTLAVPTNLKVEQDDNNAVLSWGDPVGPGYSDPPNVTGYKVTWGLAGSSAAPTVQLTSER
ncbi:MAG: hypothetical protein J0I20_19920, partial [Chloroflexi bacterium]|nr:hypothetical protein [Chloroflexota bacterium]